MNTIEEASIQAALGKLLRRFDPSDHLAIRAHLYRQIYGQKWDWIAGKLGRDPKRVIRLANLGRAILDAAIERGLDRDVLERFLRRG